MKLWNFSNFTLWNSEFQLWPLENFETGHFSIMKKLWDLKKVFSNLELEGQGGGIIMGVTRLLLPRPFYTIQTNFLYCFAHDCILSTNAICVPKLLWNKPSMCMRVVLFPTCDLRSHFSTLLHTFGGKNDHQCHLHNFYFSYMFNNSNNGSDI